MTQTTEESILSDENFIKYGFKLSDDLSNDSLRTYIKDLSTLQFEVWYFKSSETLDITAHFWGNSERTGKKTTSKLITRLLVLDHADFDFIIKRTLWALS